MNRKTAGLSGLAVLVAFLLAFPFIVSQDSFFLHTMIYLMFFVVLAAGLNLIMSTGQLSIGHAAFMGVGAYTCGILVTRYGMSFWAGWFFAGVFSGVLAWILGRITLPVKGVFFAILTFSFGEIIRMTFVNVGFFGGVNGITGIPVPAPLDLGLVHLSFDNKADFYYVVLFFSLACVTIYVRLINSQIGRIFRSISDGDVLSECCGIDTMKYKLVAFVVGSVWAGMVGGLYASYFTYINPDSFTFVESVDFIIISVVGGVGTLTGPIFGSLFLIGLPEIIRFAREYERIIYALCLILVLFFVPKGVGGAVESWIRGKSAVAKDIS